MARKKKDEAVDNSVFPKLTQGHMDMIARALSYCLSDQFGEEIVATFTPKTEAELLELKAQ